MLNTSASKVRLYFYVVLRPASVTPQRRTRCRCPGRGPEGQGARPQRSVKFLNAIYTGSSFWATVCKTVCPMLSDRCLSCLSVCPVCDVGVLWPNGWMDQDETWHAGRPRPWPHCVRWGSSSPPPKGGRAAPNFRPMSIMAKRLDGSKWHSARRWPLVQATLC